MPSVNRWFFWLQNVLLTVKRTPVFLPAAIAGATVASLPGCPRVASSNEVEESLPYRQMRKPLFVIVTAAIFLAARPSPVRASAPGTVPREQLAASLAQAQSAWQQMADPAIAGSLLMEAEARYAAATTAVVDEINALDQSSGEEPAWNWQGPGSTHLEAGGFVLELAAPESTKGAWKRGVYDRIETIHRPHVNRDVPTGLRAGLGATVLAVRDATEARLAREPGLPARGYHLPATVVLDFSGAATARPHRVKLEVLDPRQIVEWRLGKRRTLPVGADFSTPVNEEVGTHVFGRLSFLGFFRPQRALEYSGLYSFGPFEPTKIPVVFIHGLNSDPSIWANATTDLLADPALSRRYQFWYYFYPTGVPAIASAHRLRDALDHMRAVYDPAGTNPNLNQLILVGHSMGGLLAHLLVIDSGSSFYDAYFGAPLEKLPVSSAARTSIRRNLFFTARPDVDEVIFISTPHRGSSLADWGIVRFLAKLIAIPENLLQLSTQILTLNVELLNPSLRNSGLPGFSVIDSLSPRNPYFRAIEKQTIRRPFHSIIGDRGRGDTPNSSDGVVGYHSSHWDGARSEQIVPFGHSCTSQPLVFGAIHQLIRQEMAEQKTKSVEKSSRP